MNERERERGLLSSTIPACQAMVIHGEPQSISSSTWSMAKLLKESPNVAPESPEKRTSCACVCAGTEVRVGVLGYAYVGVFVPQCVYLWMSLCVSVCVSRLGHVSHCVSFSLCLYVSLSV